MKKNVKRILLCLTIITVALLVCGLFAACEIDDVKEITVTPETINVRIGEFNFADFTVTATYDSGKTETATLSEDMLPAKDRVKLFTEGEHDITVSYLSKTTTIKVNVRRNVFEGAEFNDLDVVYTGEFYTVEVKNVPEGTTVTYTSTNRFRNAGTYKATVVLRKDAFEMKEMVANVVIRKADYDISNVTFDDKEEVFNGESHILELTGELPVGLFVDYTITREGGREDKGNAAKNAGVYIVQAKCSGDTNNYNVVEPKQAILTIKQAKMDVSGLKFEDKTVVYDRTVQKLEIEGQIPLGVTVDYRNNEHVNAGVYKALAVFYIDDTVNYEPIPDMQAELTIKKADYDMSAVHFNGTKVTFDGKEKKIEIEGQLPTGDVKVTYTDNVKTSVGTYQATAKFTTQDANYNDPEPLTATLIIDPATAPMDTIVFERRRYISQNTEVYESVSYEFWPEEWKRYDPYLAVNSHRPENVPEGLTVKSVKYLKTDGWVSDLSAYDGVGEQYKDKITEDGYYIVVVEFDGHGNYTGISPVRTQVRATTVKMFTTWDLMVYDEDWSNPETNERTGVFQRYYEGSCVPLKDMTKIEFGDVTVSYCDCTFFGNYDDTVTVEDLLTTDAQWCMNRISQDIDSAHIVLNTCDCNGFIAVLDEHYNLCIHRNDGQMMETTAVLFDDVMKLYDELFELKEFDDQFYSWHLGKGEEQADEYSAYKAFYDKIKDLYKVSNVAILRDLEYDVEDGVIVGINTPFVAGVKDAAFTESERNEYLTLIARLLGYDDVDAFVTNADKLAKEYLKNEEGASTGESALRLRYDGAIYTEFLCEEENKTKKGFVIPFAFRNHQVNGVDGIVIALVLVDEKGGVSVWISNANDALSVTANAANDDYGGENAKVDALGRCILFEIPLLYEPESWCSDVSERTVSVDDEIRVNVISDKCDPFSMIAGDFGEVESLTMHIYTNPTNEVTGAFNTLAELFVEFSSRFEIPKDGSEYFNVVTGDNLNAYSAFYNKAVANYKNSFLSFVDKAVNGLSRSAVIGVNYPYTMVFDEGVSQTISYREVIAKLFGFEDIDEFMTNAQTLVETYARFRNDLSEYSALWNGCFYTENELFIFPVAVKNQVSNPVLLYVILDNEGYASVWVNDITAALWATNFIESYRTDGIVYNELYCKNKLFITAQGVIESYDAFAVAYEEFLDRFTTNDETTIYPVIATDPNLSYYNHLLEKADKLAVYSQDYMYTEERDYTLEESALIGLTDDFVRIYGETDKTLADYREMIARIMGFDDFASFTSTFDVLMDIYLDYADEVVNIDSERDRCLLKAGVLSRGSYDVNTDKYDKIYVFPLRFSWENESYLTETFNVFLIMDRLEGVNRMCAFVGNVSYAFTFPKEEVKSVEVLGRCKGTEFDRWRYEPKIITVAEGDGYVEKYATGGKDFEFLERNDATDHLIYEERDVFKFHSELTGNCAEESENYDESYYSMSTPQAFFDFCDDDPFGNIFRADGDASVITKRADRSDAPQATAEVVGKLDELANLFDTFISNYPINDEMVNEWKLGVTNRNYPAYRAYFEYAKEVFAKTNRNMGKNNEYNLSDSVLVGVNKPFAISINGGNSYTVDEYRLTVAKLFGFTDLDLFVTYANALSDELLSNKKRANTEAVSARLVYDGAIYTESGYFVLPYAINSPLSETKVLVFIFVDTEGTISVWINNARNAVNAVDFGDEFVEESERPHVRINGRCMLFEDDGYIMMEDIDSQVANIVLSLQGWSPFIITDEEEQNYVAMERIKNFSQTGEFLIYNSFTDDEGFELYFFSVYDFESEVKLEKGFYTLAVISGIDEVRKANEILIKSQISPEEPSEYDDDDWYYDDDWSDEYDDEYDENDDNSDEEEDQFDDDNDDNNDQATEE